MARDGWFTTHGNLACCRSTTCRCVCLTGRWVQKEVIGIGTTAYCSAVGIKVGATSRMVIDPTRQGRTLRGLLPQNDRSEVNDWAAELSDIASQLDNGLTRRIPIQNGERAAELPIGLPRRDRDHTC